ncbi:MAG: phage tail protein [Candidatus Hodarchaeota archaeon]
MPTRRSDDHIGNHNFKVEIVGVTQAAFMDVEGLESKTVVVEFSDGDSICVRKRPGLNSCSNIILKRGFINTDELWNWRKKVIDGMVERKDGSIIICDDSGIEIMRYNFFEAWPCRWSLSALRANESKDLVEEIELAVERIERG